MGKAIQKAKGMVKKLNESNGMKIKIKTDNTQKCLARVETGESIIFLNEEKLNEMEPQAMEFVLNHEFMHLFMFKNDYVINLKPEEKIFY